MAMGFSSSFISSAVVNMRRRHLFNLQVAVHHLEEPRQVLKNIAFGLASSALLSRLLCID